VNQSFTLHSAIDVRDAPRVVTVDVQSGQPIQVSTHRMEPVPVELRAAFKGPIQNMRAEIIKLQLRASYDMVQVMLKGLDESDYPIRGLAEDASELHGRLVSELKYTTCFALWGEQERLYRAEKLFGEAVADHFATASKDIEEAGKCLALSRGTATVFHLMRVMEVGLRVLAKTLNDPRLDPRRNPSWDSILKKGTDELTKPIADRASEWRTDDQFFSAAHANLRAVQFAWRNPTMHVEMDYNVDQAGDVMNCVGAFMRHLATQLHG